ncbi:MAG: tripartite tricarboxylate transporter substrate binding protein [Proteobacteria bacterium]|nr:tripartite tricarboxylate transporter substrate binding protein [Pseudomonadota bacterium]
MSHRNIAGRITLSVTLALGIATAATAAYPEKPVRFIVPFSTGGGTDLQGRLLADKLRAGLGQNFLVENRTGNGGLIGAEAVTKAAPDGYTVLMTSASISLNAVMQKKSIRFDLLKDLDPVTWVSNTALVLAVHPSVPARSVKELVALSLRAPSGLNIAANGVGTTSHLSAEMFKQFTKAKSVIIQYKGGGPSGLGLATGEADMLFNTPPALMPHINAKRVRALAVSTEKPTAWNPALPTMNTFYPGFVTDQWYAVFVPAGTPKNVVTTLNAQVKKALDAKEVREFYRQQALDPMGSSPEELTKLIKGEIAKYTDIVQKAGIKTR